MKREDEIDKMIENEISEESAKVSFDEIDKGISGEIDKGILTENSDDISTENNDAFDAEIEWIDADEDNTSQSKKKKKRIIFLDIIRYLIMTVALIVFGYAAYELTLIYVESAEAGDIKSEASEMFLVDLDSLSDGEERPTDANGDPIEINNSSGSLFVFDYNKMLKYNSDSKGYIRQGDGEYIDNPILQYKDNEYYLSHLANHTRSTIGAIFIDCAIEEGLEAKNCVIYGHNIGQRAGRIMFGSLNWYHSEADYHKEHPTFDIWIENRRYRYYVFASYKTKVEGSSVYQYEFADDEAFMDYIKNCKKLSKYKYDEAPEITKDSKIITLSTCTHSDEYRMIVQLVRGEELDVYGNPIEGETANKPQKPTVTQQKPSTTKKDNVGEVTTKKEEATTKKEEKTTKKENSTTQKQTSTNKATEKTTANKSDGTTKPTVKPQESQSSQESTTVANPPTSGEEQPTTDPNVEEPTTQQEEPPATSADENPHEEENTTAATE